MSFESHGVAVSIEMILRSIYNCDRFGFGGEIDADIIERDPIKAFKLGLAPYYVKADDERKAQMNIFIEELYQYEDKGIQQIGDKKIEELTSKFQDLIK